MKKIGSSEKKKRISNIEQGISNVEVKPSSFCGSLFDIRHSLFKTAGTGPRYA
jgi:hypothetical protein